MTKYSYTTFSPVTAVDNTAGLIPDHMNYFQKIQIKKDIKLKLFSQRD